jgi:multicomponent K+:H+ antiporter subunit E
MTMRARFVPHPLLAATLALVWVLLTNDFSWGAVVFGLLLGLAVSKLTSVYWPRRPRIRNVPVIIEYTGIVMWDIIVSNVLVAYLILFRRGTSLRSRFVMVPLELESPEAIAVLAGTITLTPGTVTADLSADGSALLVHCLETDDAEGTVATIKSRYERRLMRIFQ